MNKKKIVITAGIMVMFFICFLLIKSEYKNHVKQEELNQACSSMLSKVKFAYDYDSLNESEIRISQAEDITNIYNAGLLINYTSWPLKEKISEMLLTVYKYYSNICYNGDFIEASKAKKIYEIYMGVFNNINNENCDQEIDSLIKFIKEDY